MHDVLLVVEPDVLERDLGTARARSASRPVAIDVVVRLVAAAASATSRAT